MAEKTQEGWDCLGGRWTTHELLDGRTCKHIEIDSRGTAMIEISEPLLISETPKEQRSAWDERDRLNILRSEAERALMTAPKKDGKYPYYVDRLFRELEQAEQAAGIKWPEIRLEKLLLHKI